jgi:hypothetical protein
MNEMMMWHAMEMGRPGRGRGDEMRTAFVLYLGAWVGREAAVATVVESRARVPYSRDFLNCYVAVL